MQPNTKLRDKSSCHRVATAGPARATMRTRVMKHEGLLLLSALLAVIVVSFSPLNEGLVAKLIFLVKAVSFCCTLVVVGVVLFQPNDISIDSPHTHMSEKNCLNRSHDGEEIV